MEKLSVFEKSDNLKGEVKENGKSDVEKVSDLIKGKTNQALFIGGDMFKIMRKLDQSTWNK